MLEGLDKEGGKKGRALGKKEALGNKEAHR